MEEKQKLYGFALVIIVFTLPLVFAHGAEEFAIAEEIIEQKVPCEDLTSEQLEILGDYYMEQMHPGEAHEIMDERMGGEGSENLRIMHISMGESFYCGSHEQITPGMMDNMMGRSYYSNTSSSGMYMSYISLLLVIAFIILIVIIIKNRERN